MDQNKLPETPQNSKTKMDLLCFFFFLLSWPTCLVLKNGNNFSVPGNTSHLPRGRSMLSQLQATKYIAVPATSSWCHCITFQHQISAGIKNRISCPCWWGTRFGVDVMWERNALNLEFQHWILLPCSSHISFPGPSTWSTAVALDSLTRCTNLLCFWPPDLALPVAHAYTPFTSLLRLCFLSFLFYCCAFESD